MGKSTKKSAKSPQKNEELHRSSRSRGADFEQNGGLDSVVEPVENSPATQINSPKATVKKGRKRKGVTSPRKLNKGKKSKRGQFSASAVFVEDDNIVEMETYAMKTDFLSDVDGSVDETAAQGSAHEDDTQPDSSDNAVETDTVEQVDEENESEVESVEGAQTSESSQSDPSSSDSDEQEVALNNRQ